MRLLAFICLATIASVASSQVPLYKYTDREGRVVYSDSPPPSDASNVQEKRLGANTIDTSEPSYPMQLAQQRNPVTLYAGDCGPICDSARALLNRRGVPFREVDPSKPGEGQKLRELTGDSGVPVLAVGGAILLRGYEPQSWQSTLDSAGYPKTPPVRVMTIRNDAARQAAEKIAGKPPGRK